MISEYEMQNFWKLEFRGVDKEIKEENYCYYSDLPSPMAYIDLDQEIDKIKTK